MKLLLTFIIGAIAAASYSQGAYDLEIDTTCACEEIDGTFGFYATSYYNHYNGEYRDSLLWELDYTAHQTIALPKHDPMFVNYKVKFIPSDSTKAPRMSYVGYITEGTGVIHLDCYFFYENYPSFLSQLDHGEMFTITSTYFGVSHEEMIIPSYELTILKHKKKFYAKYTDRSAYNHMIGIRRLEPEEYNIKEMTLLNEVQLERFTSLQQEIVKHINDDYSGVSMSMTSIQWKGKTVRLYMDTYWSTLVWQDLEAHRDEMCLVKYNMLIKEGQERQYQEQYHEAIHFYEKAFSLGCNTDQQALKEMIESCHQALQNEHNNLVESCNKIHKAAEKHYQTENYEKALKFYELYLSKQCATQSDKEAIQERIASIHSIMDQK